MADRRETEEIRRILQLLISPDPPEGELWVDWALADALARRTGLRPVLHKRGVTAPEALREIWERRYRETEGGNLLRLQALEAIEHSFAAADLPWIALKGVDLLRRGVYGHGERPMNDLDLLIPDKRMAQAETILADAGYRYRGATPGQRAFSRGAVSVELHDLLYPRPIPFPPPEGDVWRRARRIGDTSEHLLDPGDRALYLVLHYYFEEVRRVRSWGLLRDLAAVLRRGPDLDGAALCQRARSDGTAEFLTRRVSELQRILDEPFWIPEPLRRLEVNAGWRTRQGFSFCEREAWRRSTRDLRQSTEPGLRFYLLFWAPLTRLPGILLGAGSRRGGGLMGRTGRLGRRFLLGK